MEIVQAVKGATEGCAVTCDCGIPCLAGHGGSGVVARSARQVLLGHPLHDRLVQPDARNLEHGNGCSTRRGGSEVRRLSRG